MRYKIRLTCVISYEAIVGDLALRQETKRRLGLMGGTFDPIHYGHLVAAETVRTGFQLDRVIFVPAGQPPHKVGKTISPAEDRYLMTVLAVTDNPYFEVSRIEIDRQGPSYTVDTVAAIKEAFPEEEIYFITGADAILEIFSWKDADRLLSMCQVVAVTRPGYNLNDFFLKGVSKDLLERIHFFEVPALAISSSYLRECVRKGQSIRYLLPTSVESYILKHKIYR